MREARDQAAMHEVADRWRRSGLKIALVPTMGNLHEGHLVLVHRAREVADRVVCSVYVNPAQFGEGEDFQQYPRTLDTDREQLEEAGCDLLFAPSHETMYPWGLERAVRVRAAPDLAGPLEGRCRPGHFDGVVTVVARLFNLCTPNVAVFGEKDYQQLLVIRRMTEDLGYGIRIEAVPTRREKDGLAMSSRNSYLDPDRRKAAGTLNAVLFAMARRVHQGERDFTAIESESAAKLERAGLAVEYLAIRREEDLAIPQQNEANLRVLAAVRCGQTRLIDNVSVIEVGIYDC